MAKKEERVANAQPAQNYLKDPPEDYQFPAYDIPLAFDTIVEKVQNGTYANEYEFQADLYAAFNKAKDGHFRYGPDLLTAAITFRRGVGLASVSVDAKSAPEIYVTCKCCCCSWLLLIPSKFLMMSI